MPIQASCRQLCIDRFNLLEEDTCRFQVKGRVLLVRDFNVRVDKADVVDYVPLGDHDNAITGLTIQSINGNDITFASAHGISTSDGTLESTTFNSASTVHKTNAYLANSSDLINNTTEAQEYS